MSLRTLTVHGHTYLLPVETERIDGTLTRPVLSTGGPWTSASGRARCCRAPPS